jgi:putative endonuclease
MSLRVDLGSVSKQICIEKSYLYNMKKYDVYILECSDKTYYTGFTSNLEKRMIEHKSGEYKNSYTYSKRPVSLVFHCEFTEPAKAIETEKQIKKWSKAKKEALINNELERLPNLSKKKFNTQ